MSKNSYHIRAKRIGAVGSGNVVQQDVSADLETTSETTRLSADAPSATYHITADYIGVIGSGVSLDGLDDGTTIDDTTEMETSQRSRHRPATAHGLNSVRFVIWFGGMILLAILVAAVIAH